MDGAFVATLLGVALLLDDTVLRRMQDRLDIEELRLSPIAADD